MRQRYSMDEQAARARAKFNRLQAGGDAEVAYRYLLPAEVRAEALLRAARDPRHRTLR